MARPLNPIRQRRQRTKSVRRNRVVRKQATVEATVALKEVADVEINTEELKQATTALQEATAANQQSTVALQEADQTITVRIDEIDARVSELEEEDSGPLP